MNSVFLISWATSARKIAISIVILSGVRTHSFLMMFTYREGELVDDVYEHIGNWLRAFFTWVSFRKASLKSSWEEERSHIRAVFGRLCSSVTVEYSTAENLRIVCAPLSFVVLKTKQQLNAIRNVPDAVVNLFIVGTTSLWGNKNKLFK